MTLQAESPIPPHPDPLNERSRDILAHLETVIDPETGINIVDMGLIYDVTQVGDEVRILMTMTSPACPVGDLLVEDVECCLRTHFPEPTKITVTLTFDPPWAPALMSESVRRQFGW